MGATIVIGIIAVLLGITIRYFIGRRKFNRRTITGLQGFSSYERAVGITFIEKVFNLIGLLLILGGLFFLAVAWYNHSNIKPRQEQVKQP
ncbi:MAG: molybdenum ABC transporter permease [Candidatus Pedobacter colombiensis]|uniref:Molybdenum ABC transporter permease n=1 Tax=Candidatus Pedobacter colombiensis TaxID=3121371 RepID=A0AAJ5WB26_9SPHI|nr:molybdenum ABC transporter permease [Pedobacter sp.]WEK21321.1 MAG: molybdenum ABC transporter permease [Pedobacter sp.]